MTDCPNAEMRDRLPLLASGRLDGAERAALAAHLDACADCRAELALLERVRGVTARSPAVDAARVVAAVRASAAGATAGAGGRGRWRRPAASAWRGWRVPAAAAAAALLALLAYDRDPAPPADVPPAAVAVDRGAGASGGAPVVAAVGLTFGGGLGDLSEAELERLAGSLDEIEALPSDEPQPIAPEIPLELEGTL